MYLFFCEIRDFTNVKCARNGSLSNMLDACQRLYFSLNVRNIYALKFLFGKKINDFFNECE